jgi:hypothetical protein
MIDLTTGTFTLESEVHFQVGHKGRKRMRTGQKAPAMEVEGAVPRLARLLALAIRFEGLLRAGEVRDPWQQSQALSYRPPVTPASQVSGCSPGYLIHVE